VNAPHIPHKQSQRGVAAVEFAIVASLFFMMLFGAMEMGRLLWTWNAAAEATRLGARMAVVCDLNDPSIVQRMRERLPALQASHVTIDYLNPGSPVNTCSAATCKSVRVTLAGYTHVPIIPFASLSIPIPPFQTTLPREFMQSAGNPVCN
jgi:Flp pilus assembly protein TadG